MMSDSQETVTRIAAAYGHDPGRLLSMLQAVQGQQGYISRQAIDTLAGALNVPRVNIKDTASFYAFFREQPGGLVDIRLSRSPIAQMQGAAEVAREFERVLGIPPGGVTADGRFSLDWTSHTGLCDQEPSALVNGSLVLTRIRPGDVSAIVQALTNAADEHAPPELSAADIPNAKVQTSLVQPGPVLFSPAERGEALRKALTMTPEQVIAEISAARLRGRGGAGFPTGTKWQMCRQVSGSIHYIIGNADEGELGAFKDRVLLTAAPDLVMEGLTIAGYALGAAEGIMYLRGEYAYLLPALQQVLEARRQDGWLGEQIGGHTGFNFTIRLQLGAGAYICGEETALLDSLEGKRGAPRDRPPYPAVSGYHGRPTVINNVETLACVTRILANGSAWFTGFGTRESSGTKLMSVSGDCARPGVYEVPLGLTLNQLLDLAGGAEADAVQVAGASGQAVAPKDYGRRLCFEDLCPVGATMVFGPGRDFLDVVRQLVDFFIDESCGWCAPCRLGTTLLKRDLEKILAGRGSLADINSLQQQCLTVKQMSRCGLGQSAPNPILNSLQNFPHLYEARLTSEAFMPRFDERTALADAIRVQGREPVPEEEA